MSDESLVPIPSEEVPEKIDEAFEIEKPNASITIIVNPPQPDMTFEDMQNLMAATLAYEDKAEEIEAKKQKRITKKEIGEAQVGMSNGLFWLAVGWTIVVTTALFCAGFGWMTLSDKILLALIGSAALPPIINSLIKLLSPKPKEK